MKELTTILSRRTNLGKITILLCLKLPSLTSCNVLRLLKIAWN